MLAYYCITMSPWYHGNMVPLYHGTMVQWFYGTMIPCWYVTMVPGHYDSMSVYTNVHVWPLPCQVRQNTNATIMCLENPFSLTIPCIQDLSLDVPRHTEKRNSGVDDFWCEMCDFMDKSCEIGSTVSKLLSFLEKIYKLAYKSKPKNEIIVKYLKICP